MRLFHEPDGQEHHVGTDDEGQILVKNLQGNDGDENEEQRPLGAGYPFAPWRPQDGIGDQHEKTQLRGTGGQHRSQPEAPRAPLQSGVEEAERAIGEEELTSELKVLVHRLSQRPTPGGIEQIAGREYGVGGERGRHRQYDERTESDGQGKRQSGRSTTSRASPFGRRQPIHALRPRWSLLDLLHLRHSCSESAEWA